MKQEDNNKNELERKNEMLVKIYIGDKKESLLVSEIFGKDSVDGKIKEFLLKLAEVL